ncbi:SGNH/GDSL hydrolase family protein [Nocardiopsis gilva YIM 90087]|uniref:SGNH/GDSL hydrolase family protein n=1 Tax=Nocardiopsis gilva YIM 90087 TaxID=1235441 RepID=A0A223SE07_9ACTN|nr:SGNH/GDSL hydrolase family protein [Nocardiopsis gilva]ASU86362.1 SGNH/GDSL hydrolase family protein [Nocardiopsis gilva YIM 90087]
MRIPELPRRTWVLGSLAVSLVLACVIVIAVPVTRTGMLGLWCEVTGRGCAEQPPPPDDAPEVPDWRVEMSPVDAATWGHYVALGDSYSSGDGAGDYLPGTAKSGGCWRSANAYPQRILSAYDFAGDLGFVACSSQKGRAMLKEVGSADSQLDRITPHTSLITLGVGGNDLGFTPVLRTCMVRLPLVEADACTGQEKDVEKRMEKFKATFDDLLAEIRDRAPDARVVVLGYPRLFPAKPQGMYYTLTVGDQKWLNDTIKRFNLQLENAVNRADAEIADESQVGSVEFVDIYTVFKGHEVDAEEPWLNGVLIRDLSEGIKVDRSTFHPTAAGQAAFTDRVAERIASGPGRALYVTRDTLDNADPDVLVAEVE